MKNMFTVDANESPTKCFCKRCECNSSLECKDGCECCVMIDSGDTKHCFDHTWIVGVENDDVFKFFNKGK